MSSSFISDLTLELTQGLDENYNVVNMEAILNVISVLEGTTITKEQLETTRLAKFINHLRRRTKSEHLARRAKRLLKKWRNMIGIQQVQSPHAGTSNAGQINRSKDQRLHKTQSRRFGHWHLDTGSDNFNLCFKKTYPKERAKVAMSTESKTISTTTALSVTSMPMAMPISAQSMSLAKSFMSQEHNVLLKMNNQLSDVIPPNPLKETNRDVSNDSTLPATLGPAINFEFNSVRKKSAGLPTKTISEIDAIQLFNRKLQVPIADVHKFDAPATVGEKQVSKDEFGISGAENQFLSSVIDSSNNPAAIDFGAHHTDVPSLLPVMLKLPGNEDIFRDKYNSSAYEVENSLFSMTTAGITSATATTTTTTLPLSFEQTALIHAEKINLSPIVQNFQVNETPESEILDNLRKKIERVPPSFFLNIPSALPVQSASSVNSIGNALVPLMKIPKKRGRKKGSKGIDFLLGQTSNLTPQLLLPLSTYSPGNKKVKTTKELLADLQNRKCSSTVSSPSCSWTVNQTQIISSYLDPESLLQTKLSEFSTNLNVAVPLEESNTLENSTISNIIATELAAESDETKSFHAIPEINEKIQCSSSVDDTEVETNRMKTETIEENIQSIISQLPPVDITTVDWKIYDTVPCTCKIVEIPSETPDSLSDSRLTQISELRKIENISTNGGDEQQIIAHSVENDNTKIISNEECLQTTDVDTSTFTIPLRQEKSIFDLHFNQEGKPLNLQSEKAQSSSQNVPIVVKTDQIEQKENRLKMATISKNLFSSDSATKTEPKSPIQYAPVITTALQQEQCQEPSKFVVQEDPNCPAKYHYVTKTNQECDAFQKLLTPNIYGNWIDRKNSEIVDLEMLPYCDMISGTDALIQENDTDQMTTDGFWVNIVPKYSSLMDDFTRT